MLKIVITNSRDKCKQNFLHKYAETTPLHIKIDIRQMQPFLDSHCSKIIIANGITSFKPSPENPSQSQTSSPATSLKFKPKIYFITIVFQK